MVGFRGKLSDEDIADVEVVRDVAMATIYWLSIYGAHWCHLANMTEASMCGGNAALSIITLTTCFHYYSHLFAFVFQANVFKLEDVDEV